MQTTKEDSQRNPYRCMLIASLWMRYEDIAEDIISDAEREKRELTAGEHHYLLDSEAYIQKLTPPFEACVREAVPFALGLITGASRSISEAVASATDTFKPVDKRMGDASMHMTRASIDLDQLSQMVESEAQK